MNFAPIIIFTYQRKIDEVVESLLENKLAHKSELYIFSDGYKNETDKTNVLEVRDYIKNIQNFKSINIIERRKNYGLADNIISGVTEMFKKYKSIIVLEDDVVVSEDFLEYMNSTLTFYANDEKIWSISGYTPDLDILKEIQDDIYLTQRGTSWVWATWEDRWNSIDWKIKDWERFRENKQSIKKFNNTGNDMFKLLELQMLGKINSWAIRWDYNQFKQNQYTVFPKCSKALNIGFSDEMASNTGDNKWDIFDVQLCNNKLYLQNINSKLNILEEFRQMHNIGLYTKLGYFLKKYGGYKMAKKIVKLIRSI